MKKKKEIKLALKKETISKLNDSNMGEIIGGDEFLSSRNDCTGFLCCDPSLNCHCTSDEHQSCTATIS